MKTDQNLKSFILINFICFRPLSALFSPVWPLLVQFLVWFVRSNDPALWKTSNARNLVRSRRARRGQGSDCFSRAFFRPNRPKSLFGANIMWMIALKASVLKTSRWSLRKMLLHMEGEASPSRCGEYTFYCEVSACTGKVSIRRLLLYWFKVRDWNMHKRYPLWVSHLGLWILHPEVVLKAETWKGIITFRQHSTTWPL